MNQGNYKNDYKRFGDSKNLRVEFTVKKTLQ